MPVRSARCERDARRARAAVAARVGSRRAAHRCAGGLGTCRRDDRGRDPRPAARDPRARRARTPYWTRRGRDRAVLPSRGPIRLRAGTPATRMVGPRRPSEAPRRRLRRLDGADEAHLIPTTVLAVPSGNLVTQFAVARFTQG